MTGLALQCQGKGEQRGDYIHAYITIVITTVMAIGSWYFIQLTLTGQALGKSG